MFCSWWGYRDETQECFCEVLKINKFHYHANLKVPSMFIPLAHINSSRKIVSISSVAKSTFLKFSPLVLAGYSHLIHMPTFETNSLIINIKVPTNQPCKTKHRWYVIQEGVKFPIWIQLAFRDWLLWMMSCKAALKILVLPPRIYAKSFCRN